jgi:glycosyltransferase involved in cell wall biosynthesis
MVSVDPCYKISSTRFLVNRLVFGVAYKKADLVLSQDRFYVDKLRRLYGIDPGRVVYLPNPVQVSDGSSIAKSKEPLICYLARMDPQKRYWLFFELARQFPEYRFIAMGRPSVLYEGRYREVISRYRGLRNLDAKSFVSEGEKQEILNSCYLAKN